jgi:hypothetical protein
VGRVVGQVQAPPKQTPFLRVQTAPQAPQFCSSVMVSAQVPMQSVGAAAGQAQAPDAHSLPPVHARPQPLQCRASRAVSTHSGEEPVHRVTVAGEVSQVQAPPLQVPRPQARVQLPQNCLSVCRSTHFEPQRSGALAGQPQVPAWHVPPLAQGFPHAPQCSTSVCRFLQAPLQLVSPVGHAGGQAVKRKAAAAATVTLAKIPMRPH